MTMDIATLGIRVDATEARLAAVELERLGAAGGHTATSMTAVERATKLLAGAFAGLTAIEVAKQIIGVNREFETLKTSLITTTGSVEKAGLAFRFIQDFAAKTPFDVQQVTESFIKLGNLGLKPSEEALRSYGNTAAAQAKPIMQMIEAVADAATGEFERLKEFGIKAKVHGDNVNFVFQGVTTEVKNNAQAIEGYLIHMGNTKFGDAMANQSNTMNGAISNLGDTWNAFMDNILNDAKENMIAKWVQTASEALHWFDVQMNGAIRSADKLAEVDARIAANKAALNAHDKNGAVGSLIDGLAGYDPSLVKNRIDADIKLRERLTETIGTEKTAQDALIATMGVSSTTQDKSTESKKAQDKAAKEAAKSAKDAQRAEDALAKSFDDTLSSLNLHNIELSKTPRELEAATLASKGYTQAMINQAMALYDIGAALEAKKKINELEKSELESLTDKYNQLTLSARDYFATTLDAKKIPTSEQAPIMAQFDKVDGAEKAKKSTEDAKTTLDAYNKSLAEAKNKTSDLGAISSSVFDGALGGISAMAGAFDNMVNSIAENTKALAENAKMQKVNEKTSDPAEKAANSLIYAKQEAKLNADNLKANITGAAQMAGAASKMFDQKSTAAKAFHAVEVGLGVARMAMDAVEMARTITKTALNVAAGAAAMFKDMGPWGFAGVAAMLAVMAGLGVAASSSGGGGTQAPPETSKGTGTVLGDSTAVSESVSKTWDLLKSIHASEYSELRGINAGVSALKTGTESTINKLFQSGGIKDIAAPKISGWESFVNAMGPFWRGIFGSAKTEVTGGGIQTGATSVGNIMNGQSISGQEYTTIKKTVSSWFSSDKVSYSEMLSGLDSGITDSLTMVYKAMGTTMLSLAKSFGGDLTTQVSSTIIPALKVELRGLSGADAAKVLNGVISATLDGMASNVFGAILKQYQKLGEGMLETAVRVASEIAVVKDALAQSGLKLSTNFIAVSDSIVQAAGSIKDFQAAFETYYSAFYSDSEKTTRTYNSLSSALSDVNLTLAGTRAGYRKQIEALDMTNSLDQQRYSTLINLAGAADTYYTSLEKISASMKLMTQDNFQTAIDYKRYLSLASLSGSSEASKLMGWDNQTFMPTGQAAVAQLPTVSVPVGTAGNVTDAINTMSSSNTDVANEIKLLRDQQAAQALAIDQNTAETSRLLKRWDGDGMPAVRTTV